MPGCAAGKLVHVKLTSAAYMDIFCISFGD